MFSSSKNRHISVPNDRDQATSSTQNSPRRLSMNPFKTSTQSNNVSSTPSNSPESNVALAMTTPANETQQSKPRPRPTELLPLHTNAETKSDTNKTNPIEQVLNQVANECRTSSCSRCNDNCVCDTNKASAMAIASIKCAPNSQHKNNGHDISTNTVVTIPAQPSSGTLKTGVNKCIGPTPSPPHVPIFVNRFPNNHPTYLPPHIR